MWSRCDHVSLCTCMERSRIKGRKSQENNTDFSAFVKGSILSGDYHERKNVPYIWPQVNQGQSGGKNTPRLLPHPVLQECFRTSLYQLSYIPTHSYSLWTTRQAQTPSRSFRIHLKWELSPPCSLRSCLRVAVRGGAVRQGRLGVEREPAFGSQGVRILEDLCLARWDGLCLLCFGAVPQHRCAAEIVATAA